MGSQGLYFIRNPLTGLIKVGVSDDLMRRMKGLELASGVRLEPLGWVPEASDLEKRLHAAFAETRKVGEWFEASEELTTLATSATRESVLQFLAERSDRIAQLELDARARREAAIAERAAVLLGQKAAAKEKADRRAERKLRQEQREREREEREDADHRAAQQEWRTRSAETLRGKSLIKGKPEPAPEPTLGRQRDRNLQFAGLLSGTISGDRT